MLIAVGESDTAGGGSVGRQCRRWSEVQKRQIVAETFQSEPVLTNATGLVRSSLATSNASLRC